MPIRVLPAALPVPLSRPLLSATGLQGSASPLRRDATPSAEALQAVLHKIITLILKLLTRREGLI